MGRIDEWLSEGIDIDADGQFSERSVGNYSSVTHIWLIIMARLLDRDDLLEPVRRNLELTMYHLHPDGELEAIASRRQDQWRRNYVYSARPVPDNFHLPYRYLALRDRHAQFAAMTQPVEETGVRHLQRKHPARRAARLHHRHDALPGDDHHRLSAGVRS